MCNKPTHIFSTWEEPPLDTHFSTPALNGKTPCAVPPRSSRRARIWELPHHALCPVIGVCLPLPLLRKLVGKAVGGAVQADDYELHCGVINECKQRSAVSQRIQQALDERYSLTLQRHRSLKDSGALAQAWAAGLHSPEVAAIFWSVVTHPACDAALLEQVLQDVHMLQHQVGMMQRLESEQLQDLLKENAVLARELASAQARSTRQAADFARQVERLESAQCRLRADLLQRDTLLAHAQEDLAQLKASLPDLPSRQSLVEDKRWLTDRLETAQRALQAAQQQILHGEDRRHRAPAALTPSPSDPAAESPTGDTPDLSQKAVLCVGGRSASVPIYRRVVEHTGGQFMHHDGGEEHNAHQLDAALAAADLVLCQTACISHDAYWKVKDHCKRTGKRCVFVETPSQTALQKALRVAAEAAQQGEVT
ncbi:MAG: DUF2325 domain-containing protein [Ideonella sp.]|nr:DUF2325 domain-containing protein [Ideonella sp.]